MKNLTASLVLASLLIASPVHAAMTAADWILLPLNLAVAVVVLPFQVLDRMIQPNPNAGAALAVLAAQQRASTPAPASGMMICQQVDRMVVCH